MRCLVSQEDIIDGYSNGRSLKDIALKAHFSLLTFSEPILGNLFTLHFSTGEDNSPKQPSTKCQFTAEPNCIQSEGGGNRIYDAGCILGQLYSLCI